MIAFLRGVPGKLKTITDYLTTHMGSARMGKIDTYLDATTSSRAPASTALSTAVYSSALATILGNTIQTSVIQSIQTGRASGGRSTGTGEDCAFINVTIASVNTAKCVVLIDGVSWNQTGYAPYSPATMSYSARLTSATNLRISLQGDENIENAARGQTMQNMSGRWTVIEFK